MSGRGRIPDPRQDVPACSVSPGEARDAGLAELAAMCGPDAPAGESFIRDRAADALLPGPVLAALAEQAVAEMPGLTDNGLLGAVSAVRRLRARADYLEAVLIAEFSRRRPDHPAARDAGRPGRRRHRCRPGVRDLVLHPVPVRCACRRRRDPGRRGAGAEHGPAGPPRRQAGDEARPGLNVSLPRPFGRSSQERAGRQSDAGRSRGRGPAGLWEQGEGCRVDGTDDAKMAPVQGSDVDCAESFGDRHHDGVSGAQRRKPASAFAPARLCSM